MRTEPLLIEADALLARGRADNAANLLAPYVGREPGDIGGWHRMARARLELGDAHGALRAAGAAWQLDPDGAESLFWVSRACTALGEHAEAIEAAYAACQDDPGNPRLHNRLGEAQLAAGLVADAAEGLRIAVDLAGYDPDLYVTYGLALFAGGRPLSAREAVGRALALNPEHAGARSALTRFEQAMRGVVDAPTLAQAVDDFTESLLVRPGDHLAVRLSPRRDALGYVARVTMIWFLAAFCVSAALNVTGFVAVPDDFYFGLLCATAGAGLIHHFARRT
ncbi:tetratricopeptide repeat protein [Actinoplanes aureus]|uniref:Tetratricopeptide repeat protein n=1 Tax=Actinoplanes aureus TaxID=2792083 RepID=A0A931C0P3_9ACTN|nr:tetratricopeptide repeat protein [Actinoplanes aureus]MBG0561125.1 tetratricopeptide repeat protein [Actinoplanes aureus]